MVAVHYKSIPIYIYIYIYIYSCMDNRSSAKIIVNGDRMIIFKWTNQLNTDRLWQRLCVFLSSFSISKASLSKEIEENRGRPLALVEAKKTKKQSALLFLSVLFSWVVSDNSSPLSDLWSRNSYSSDSIISCAHFKAKRKSWLNVLSVTE